MAFCSLDSGPLYFVFLVVGVNLLSQEGLDFVRQQTKY